VTDDDDLFKMLNRAEEMSLENWRVYRALYNAELGNLANRIEELEATLSHYACGCKEDKCTPEEPRYRDIKCGWPARQALEGKKND
jgi:hypothetical protein